MKRLLLTAICCLAVVALTWRPADAVDAELGIGSQAPPLNVEHWITTGNGYFEPVEQFKSGQVYVVEFWATWCGPCIASMPHLAELQDKYRGRGVQIISISDEQLEEIKPFLEREHPEVDKTFAEITSSYSLTTDPDGSSHEAYMAASGQNGIPVSYLVGKSGLIEWYGHPMELDEPLEAVVEGSWDREAYKRELKLREERERIREQVVREVSSMLGEGEVDEAVALLKSRIEQAEQEALAEDLRNVLHQVKLFTGRLDEETVGYYRDQLKEAKGTPMAVAQFGYMMYGAAQQGAELGPLADEVIEALKAETSAADAQQKPSLYDARARLLAATGKLDAAAETLRNAIEATQDDSTRERFREMLQDLEESAGAEQGN